MTDESALDADLRRGAQAEALLRSELLNEAFATLERDYIAAWQATTARDTDARERLWQAVQVVGKVRTHLQSAANDGTLAKRELDDLARAGERKKVFGVI